MENIYIVNQRYIGQFSYTLKLTFTRQIDTIVNQISIKLIN